MQDHAGSPRKGTSMSEVLREVTEFLKVQKDPQAAQVLRAMSEGHVEGMQGSRQRTTTPVFTQTTTLTSRVAEEPSVPWQLHITWGSNCRLDNLATGDFIAIFWFLRSEARRLLSLTQRLHMAVGRIGMLYDGLSSCMRLTPMTGTKGPWKPITAPVSRYTDKDEGYIDTASGPRLSSELLGRWQRHLFDPSATADLSFSGDKPDVLFARIVRGKEEHWRIFENADTVGFLTPFANSRYCAVLVPRENMTSDIFGLDDIAYLSLVQSAHELACKLQLVESTGIGIAFEGFEIDYAHVKFYPRFAAKNNADKRVATQEYAGMLTSLAGERLTAEELVEKQALLDSVS